MMNLKEADSIVPHEIVFPTGIGRRRAGCGCYSCCDCSTLSSSSQSSLAPVGPVFQNLSDELAEVRVENFDSFITSSASFSHAGKTHEHRARRLPNCDTTTRVLCPPALAAAVVSEDAILLLAHVREGPEHGCRASMCAVRGDTPNNTPDQLETKGVSALRPACRSAGCAGRSRCDTGKMLEHCAPQRPQPKVTVTAELTV